MKMPEMILNRIELLRKRIAEKGMDASFITCDEHVDYFSGFVGDSTELLIAMDTVYLFTDSRYTEQAENQAKGYTVIETGHVDRYQKIDEKLKYHHVNKLGIEKSNVTVSDFTMLENAFSAKAYDDISDIIGKIRVIKSDEELKIMSEGAKISDAVYLELLDKIKPGISEMDIFSEMTYLFNKRGLEMSFRPIIASGENSALPHAPLTNRILKNGDLLTLDFGCKYQSYCTDCTRTIAIGGLASKQKKVYDIVEIAQKKAFDAIRPGITTKELDAVARDIISENGYGDNFGHGLGHGVGLFIHEAPTVSPRSDETLSENMVITIEPGIYLKGRFGVRIEDMCYVAKDKGISFNALDKRLVII